MLVLYLLLFIKCKGKWIQALHFQCHLELIWSAWCPDLTHVDIFVIYTFLLFPEKYPLIVIFNLLIVIFSFVCVTKTRQFNVLVCGLLSKLIKSWASCARTVGSDTSKTQYQYVKNSLSQMIESTCQFLYKEQVDCLESVQHGCQNQ